METDELLQAFSTEAVLGQQIRWDYFPVNLAQIDAAKADSLLYPKCVCVCVCPGA